MKFNINRQAGYHRINLNASDLSSGIYIYSLTAESIDGRHQYKCTKKMVLLKKTNHSYIKNGLL